MILDNVDIARVAHEANRALQGILGEEQNPPWDECDSDLKASGVDGVVAAREGKSPEELHDNWCEFKIAQGWTYGDVKDPEAKTHPCLTDYEALPLEQRLKDHLFRAVVLTLASPEASEE